MLQPKREKEAEKKIKTKDEALAKAQKAYYYSKTIKDICPRFYQLIIHPNRSLVQFSKLSKCFMLKKNTEAGGFKKLRGLLPLLRKVYWPDYVYTEGDSNYHVSTGAGGLKEGINRGKLVHRQLRDFTNKSEKYFRSVHGPSIHDYTLNVVKAKLEWGTTTGVAEFPLFDEELGIGTAADDISLQGNNTIVVSDWKVGQDSSFRVGSGPMKGVLSHLSNSPFNQACVQLLFNYIFLLKTYGLRPDKLYAVQICTSGVDPREVPWPLIENANSIYNDFKVRLAEIDMKEKAQRDEERARKREEKKQNKKKKGTSNDGDNNKRRRKDTVIVLDD